MSVLQEPLPAPANRGQQPRDRTGRPATRNRRPRLIRLRGMRERATMLELRKKDGNITAIGYAWIEKIEFDPSEGITIHALGQQVKIKGRNLNAEVRPGVSLFQGLTRHRVPWIQESLSMARTGDACSGDLTISLDN